MVLISIHKKKVVLISCYSTEEPESVKKKKNFISRCKFVLRDEIETTLCCNIWMSQNPMRQLYQMAA
jgi:hypothetical protein